MTEARELLERAYEVIDEAHLEDGNGERYEWEILAEIEAYLSKPEEKAEPVAQVGGLGYVRWLITTFPKRGAYLYTTPPKRESLSDDSVKQIIDDIFECDSAIDDTGFILVRAIERAHGIGVDNDR